MRLKMTQSLFPNWLFSTLLVSSCGTVMAKGVRASKSQGSEISRLVPCARYKLETGERLVRRNLVSPKT